MNPSLRWHLGAALLALSIAGCGGGGGGALTGDVGLGLASYIILDLDAGTVVGRQSLSGVDLDAGKRQQIIFVRIPDGAGLGGAAAGERWALADETPRAIGASRLFIAIHETTRGQWRRLAGTEPWNALEPGLRGADDDRVPAVNLGRDTVVAALAAASARLPGTLRLPTAAEWEWAARAGTTTAFSWGAAVDTATAGRYAVTADTVPAVSGPLTVGGREANGWGLHDVHGNVWELTDDGELRGGSWQDGLPMARSANRPTIPRACDHALAGVRIVYRPD